MTQRIRERLCSHSSSFEGVASFIRKTYELLEDREQNDLITWSDCGNYLIIRDIQEFSQKVLPVYFKHSNMNSFVRQLNMYNFHKKRTMTSDHVYFHDLFKRGNVELLKHIKRKHSDGSNGLASLYEITHGYSFNTEELSHENLLLKKLNQKAFSQISTLEARVNGLIQENDMLCRKIMEKEKSEQVIESAFSKYFSSEGNSPSDTTETIISKKDRLLLKEIKESMSLQQLSNFEKSSHTGSGPEDTPIYPSDSLANIDAYLLFEQVESSSNSDSHSPSMTKGDYSEASQIYHCRDEDSLLKRKYQEANPSTDDEEEEPQSKKRPMGFFVEDDQVPIYPEFDFPNFLGFQEEKI